MKGNKMLIKAIKSKSEINKIIPLFIRVFSESPYEEKWKKKSALQRLDNLYKLGNGFCFYAEEHGKAIGILFCRTQIWDDGTHVFIEDLAVEPHYRREGIGTKLVKKLEKAARAKKISAIDILANKKAKALKFWEKLGYKQDGYVNMKKRL